jgi:hypothetical protein
MSDPDPQRPYCLADPVETIERDWRLSTQEDPECPIPEGRWEAWYEEMPYLIIHGTTEEEAVAELRHFTVPYLVRFAMERWEHEQAEQALREQEM